MLGDNIKKRRLELGYKQEDVVEINKKAKGNKEKSFSVRQLSSWENNSATPSVENLFDLATVLNTTVNSLRDTGDTYNTFIDRFNNIASNKYDKYNLLIDFLTMGGLSYTQPLELNMKIKDNREKRFLEIEKKYTKEEMIELSKLLADLTLIYDTKSEVIDVLGDIIIRLDIPEDKKMKFYQRWDASLTMASINFGNFDKEKNEKDFYTVFDPICGVGSTILATAHILKAKRNKLSKRAFCRSMGCRY